MNVPVHEKKVRNSMTHLLLFIQTMATDVADPTTALQNLAGVMVKFVGGALAVAFAYGGYLWFTSAENPTRRSAAYGYLIGSAIGGIVVVFAAYLAQQVTTAIGG